MQNNIINITSTSNETIKYFILSLFKCNNKSAVYLIS